MSEKPRVRVSSSGAMIGDSLKNYVANLGTDRDKAAHTTYVDTFLSSHDLNTNNPNTMDNNVNNLPVYLNRFRTSATLTCHLSPLLFVLALLLIAGCGDRKSVV